jgi:hypothetical protein
VTADLKAAIAALSLGATVVVVELDSSAMVGMLPKLISDAVKAATVSNLVFFMFSLFCR